MFGEKVKEYRLKKNIPSLKLSSMLGKSPAYISQIEKGRNKKPDSKTLNDLFCILDFSPEDKEIVINDLGKSQTVDRSLSKFSQFLTEEDLNQKYYNDAEELANVIMSLPKKTREILKEMLDEEI